MRRLGIRTVVDRLLQQAMHQGMSPVWELDFFNHSYGFDVSRLLTGGATAPDLAAE